MKICKKCRVTYSDEMKFCKRCGTPLVVVQNQQKPGNMQHQGAGQKAAGQNMQQKAGNVGQRQNAQQRAAGVQQKTAGAQQKKPVVKAEKSSNKVGFIIAIIAAVLIVIAATVLILFKLTDVFDSGSNSNRVEADDDNDKNDKDDDEDTDDEESDEESESETEPGANADINAVVEEVQTLTGQFLENDGDYVLVFEDALSFYVNDTAYEPVMMEDVEEISVVNLDSTYKKYADHEVAVTGSVFAEDDGLIIMAEDIEALDLDVNPLVEVSVGTHNYKIVMSNGTWQEAFDTCLAQGGYLARIDSAEEYDKIVSLINSAGNSKETHYYIGGRRDADGTEYYWVDSENNFTGELLNSSDSWTNGYWYKGEPSFEDAGSGQYNGIDEAYLNLFCVNNVWYINDGSGDFYGNYPSLLAGKIGYVMEYE